MTDQDEPRPTRRPQRLLAAHLGFWSALDRSLRRLRRVALQGRVHLARRELVALHRRERARLLLEAGMLAAHTSDDADVVRRARAVWPGPLPTPEEWRVRCGEELVCGRGTSPRPPRLLRRLLARPLDAWPEPETLVRAAARVSGGARAELELLRARFVAGEGDAVRAELEQLWRAPRLTSATRVELLATLAVLHEAAGRGEAAARCWSLVNARDAAHLTAHVSRFALALSACDERGARLAERTLRRLVRERSEDRAAGRAELRAALRRRAWIGRVARIAPAPGARALRLALLAEGRPLLTELCLGIA